MASLLLETDHPHWPVRQVSLKMPGVLSSLLNGTTIGLFGWVHNAFNVLWDVLDRLVQRRAICEILEHPFLTVVDTSSFLMLAIVEFKNSIDHPSDFAVSQNIHSMLQSSNLLDVTTTTSNARMFELSERVVLNRYDLLL